MFLLCDLVFPTSDRLCSTTPSSLPPLPPQGQVKRLTRQLQIHANDRGSCAQRVAYYFLDALKARADGTGAEKYNMAAQVPAQVRKEIELNT